MLLSVLLQPMYLVIAMYSAALSHSCEDIGE